MDDARPRRSARHAGNLGFFGDRGPDRTGNAASDGVLGTLGELADYVKNHRVDLIYITLPMVSQPRILKLLDELCDTTASIYLTPDIFLFDLIQARMDSVGAMPVVAVCETPFYGLSGLIKRASEYRYRKSVPNPRALIIAISQSGETADTLAAIQHARSLGHRYCLAICNVPESALVRAADLRFLTRAGPEIGVASTKAFTTQLAALVLFTMTLAKLRGRLSPDQESALLNWLRHLPSVLANVLHVEPQVRMWAEKFARRQHALFLGRGIHYPIAMEGALKLKENFLHPRRGICRGRTQARSACAR